MQSQNLEIETHKRRSLQHYKKYKKGLMNKYQLGIILCITLSSCVSTYQSIQIKSLTINDYRYSLKESNVEITLDYDVLTGSSNKIYSKMEKKNNVSLVVMHVQNLGQKELILPKDLLIQTNFGDSIQPLEFTLAIEALIDPVTNNENTSGVKVEAPWSWKLMWGAGKGVNQAKKGVSNVRFYNDMSEHYLEKRTLKAGSNTTGFLVLPVKKGTPLKVSLR